MSEDTAEATPRGHLFADRIRDVRLASRNVTGPNYDPDVELSALRALYREVADDERHSDALWTRLNSVFTQVREFCLARGVTVEAVNREGLEFTVARLLEALGKKWGEWESANAQAWNAVRIQGMTTEDMWKALRAAWDALEAAKAACEPIRGLGSGLATLNIIDAALASRTGLPVRDGLPLPADPDAPPQPQS